jgi:hypothetical protein
VRGQISVQFETAAEALEKLMAIGNDRDRFERIATGRE